MTERIFDSVWDALEDTPAEAANMKLRSSLVVAIIGAVAAWHVPPSEAATRLGATLPCLDELLRGQIGKFSVDTLVVLAARAGLAVHTEVTLAA